MAFKEHGSLNPHGGPIFKRVILQNSQQFSELDAVLIDSDGFLDVGSAATSLLGHLKAISKNTGVGVNTSGAAGATVGSFVGTYTAASDNETVDQVRGEVDISQFTLYSAEVDATLGTTTGSDQAGYYLDLIDEDTLDESSAVRTGAQYYSWDSDPLDSSRLVVNLFESEVFTTSK